MKLSIVTTLYGSEKYIDDFYSRITVEAKKITDDYELIFVDDGSPDNSLQKCLDIYEVDNKIRIIEFSRNFGHHMAIMAGLKHSLGEYVFLIDSDLEEDPELLGSFWHDLELNPDLDYVYGVQGKVRKGNFFERTSGKIYYKIFNFLSEEKIPENFLTVRLMRKQYVGSLLEFQERELVFSIVTILSGYKSKKRIISKKSHSKSTYTLRKKLYVLFNTITSSSVRPLLLAFNVGLITIFFSLTYILYLLYRKFFEGIGIDGWVSVMVVISFFGGLIIFFLGIIGIYISKIFIESKTRPNYIIKKIHQFEENI